MTSSHLCAFGQFRYLRDTMNDKKWIREGMEVAEIDNPTHKMVVKRILKKTKKIATYKRDANGDIIYTNKTIMEGVECYWWKDNEMVTDKFHTKRLVPYEVATKGQKEIIEFLESRV